MTALHTFFTIAGIAAFVFFTVWVLIKIIIALRQATQIDADDALRTWAASKLVPFSTDDAARALGIPDHSLDQATMDWIRATLKAAGYRQLIVFKGSNHVKLWNPQPAAQPRFCFTSGEAEPINGHQDRRFFPVTKEGSAQ